MHGKLSSLAKTIARQHITRANTRFGFSLQMVRAGQIGIKGMLLELSTLIECTGGSLQTTA